MFLACSIVDLSNGRTGQSMRNYCCDEKHFVYSGEICSGVVTLGLLHALVLAQERQDNRPQHLIHVRLADQSK